MAELTHNLHPDMRIVTDGAVKNEQGYGWENYTVQTEEGTYSLNLSVSPEDLQEQINDSRSQGYAILNTALDRLKARGTPRRDPSDRGMFLETMVPAATKGLTANLTGAPVDVMNLATEVVADVPINFFNWAMGDFEGPMPQKRYLSSAAPIGGSAQIAAGMESAGRFVEGVREAAEEEHWALAWAAQLLRPFEFDLTPDESTVARQYVSLITQIAAGAPIEGAAIAQLAVQLAKTTKSATHQGVYDALSEMQRTNPARAAMYEGLMGTAIGSSMVGSLEALEEVYPNAPQWMKNTVMAGGGLLLPIGAVTGVTTGYKVGLKAPLIKYPLRILQGATEALTPSGAERAASRAIQTFGSDWKHRNEILGVVGQLRLALKEGRNMDEATRIVYTTPQLARNEAAFLEARLLESQASKQPPTPSEIDAETQLIRELRQYANFQEGQLRAILESQGSDAGVGSRAYAMYSERMLDRRDSIFQALDEAILKLDLGGRPSEGVSPRVIEADYEKGLSSRKPFVYNENRLRAVSEGQLGSMSPEQQVAIRKAWENVSDKVTEANSKSIADAQERVDSIRKEMDEQGEMLTAQDRENFNVWIRDEIETSYIEMDAYEDALWNAIPGLEARKTQSHTAPDGTDLGPQLLIDGVPIGEHFAAKAASVAETAGAAQNQSKWLWKLAGRDELVDQGTKGPGPDSEKVKKQNLRVKQAQDRLDQRQEEADRASEKLAALEEDPPVSKKTQAARDKYAELQVRKQVNESELREIADHLKSSIGGESRFIDDQSASGYLRTNKWDSSETKKQKTRYNNLIAKNNNIDADIAVQRRKASDPDSRLTEGLPAPTDRVEVTTGQAVHPEIERARTAVEKTQDLVTTAQSNLDMQKGLLDIAWGKDVEFQGSAVDVQAEVKDTGELGVQTIDGVPTGRSGQEINNIIGTLKREMAFEQGRGALRNPQKVVAIGELIDDLQRALVENFDLDLTALDAARALTALKKGVFERGSVSKVRGFKSTREAVVPIEQTMDVIVPGRAGKKGQAKQETALRELEIALTPIAEGEGTPFRLEVSVGPDGKKTFNVEIDPDASLIKYAEEPAPPFERIMAGGRSQGYKIKEGTPLTDENIRLIRDTLWERFQAFKNGSDFDLAGATKWLNNNKAALEWLKKATPPDKLTGFEDIVSAERILDALQNAGKRSLEKTVERLRKEGAFNDEFTEQGFRQLMKEANARNSQIISAANILDNPDPLTVGPKFLAEYTNSSNPQDLLRETLKVFDNAVAPDGKNPALEGFKRAIAEAIIQKGLTGPNSKGFAAEQAAKLSSHLKSPVRLWDPDALIAMAGDKRFNELLRGLYGEDAPKFFRDLAKGAEEQFEISRSAKQGVRRQDIASTEVAGNIGRVIGGFLARFVPVSPLVLTGVGRRYGVALMGAVRGSAVDRLIIDFLMDPNLAAAATKKFPELSDAENLGVWARLRLAAHRNFIDANAKRIKRLGQAPGSLYEIGEPTKYQDQDERAARAEKQRLEWINRNQGKSPSASLSMPQAIPASVLGQINPLNAGISPQQVAARGPDPQTAARGQQVFGAMDPIFSGPMTAAHGGIASIKPKKPRQMVL